jgi:hypothetical protein
MRWNTHQTIVEWFGKVRLRVESTITGKLPSVLVFGRRQQGTLGTLRR